MIKLNIKYSQVWGEEVLENTYTRYFSEDDDIEREKLEIRERLHSDPCVQYVWIDEEVVE